jgi:hypothetical protein
VRREIARPENPGLSGQGSNAVDGTFESHGFIVLYVGRYYYFPTNRSLLLVPECPVGVQTTVTELCPNYLLKRLGLTVERRADSPDCCNC